VRVAVNILGREFKIADYYSSDTSAELHVRRVFGRLGLCGPGAAVEAVIYRARACLLNASGCESGGRFS
jgi:hypothetical protein